ncbi:helix-turn-helix domain-containing protein [Micromonospora sp. SH-82]
MVNELPVGRRVAQWRIRRNMTQQQFADRLGKSKSWVDKVERGVRRLERVSSLREVAEALRIEMDALLPERPGRAGPGAGVERLRAALARYHVPTPTRPPDLAELRVRIEHAEQSYRHARYPALLTVLPDLLDAVREARATLPGRTTDGLLVPVYGLIAVTLIKVDQPELAWLAADRGMSVALAVGEPRLAGVATVPLVQALRGVGRHRSAVEAAVVAAHRLRPPGDARPADPSLVGVLLSQAALAAAGRGDESGTRELIHRARALATTTGADTGLSRSATGGRDADVAAPRSAVGSLGPGLSPGGASFGSASVAAVEVVAETALGHVAAATVRHERLLAAEGWRWLPPEHRAAYLLDAARAYTLAGDMFRAGRTLLEAERTARSEVHDRPAVRDLVAVVARAATAPAGLARLAADLHVT